VIQVIRNSYEQEGFRYLGSGSYGCVFIKTRDRVIKVIANSPKLEDIKIHLDYLALCQLFPNEPAFPKVYSFGKDSLGLDVIEIEKLIHCEFNDVNNLIEAAHYYWDKYSSDLKYQYQDIAKGIDLIKEYIPNSRWDIRLCNVMQRESTGEFVLSDPIY
jgi:hypothetical protein